MDEELEIGSKRVPSNITYPPAGHYVVRRMRELEERISCYVINDNDKQQDAKVRAVNKEEQQLLHQDYQLYAALTVLKGLAVAKR